MKKKIIFLILPFFLILKKAIGNESIIICGKIYSENSISPKIYMPINNYFNYPLLEGANKNYFISKDSFYFKDNLNKASSIYLYFTTENRAFVGASVFLGEPGDSIHLRIDPAIKTSEWLLYSGSNADGNNLFYKINFKLGEKYIPVDDLIKSYLSKKVDFVDKFSTVIDSIMYPFGKILESGKITTTYYSLTKKNFTTLFSEYIIRKLIFPPKQILSLTKGLRIKLIDSLLEIQSASDEDIKPLFNSAGFIEIYYYYLQYRKKNIISAEELNKNDTIIHYNGKEEIIDKNLAHLIDIDNRSDKEMLWAFFVSSLLQSFYNEKTIAQYQRLFPENNFTTYLIYRWNSRKYIDKPIYTLQSPIILIDSNGMINSFKKIFSLSELKKTNLLIDLWASWCIPCIEEFSFNKELDSFLIKHHVKRLYLSFDGTNNKQRWIKAIEKYKLGGTHILMGDGLIKELHKRLNTKSSTISIPRFILIDKKRQYFQTLEAWPSDGSEFYKQIEKTWGL